MGGFSMSSALTAARLHSRPCRWLGRLMPLLTAGCALTGGPPATAAPEPRLTAPLVSVSSSAPVEAYRSYWQTVQRAALTANWRDPQLTLVASGPALHAVTQALYGWSRAHQRARGHVELRPTLVSASPTTARLTDCQDSSGWVLYAPGRHVSPAPTSGRDFAAVTLTFTAGRWKVTDLRFDRTRTC